MGTCIVKTGFGYFKNSAGQIIAKAKLPAGEHPLTDGFSYYEVDTLEDLDAIVIYKKPPTTEELFQQLCELKIKTRIRKMAIESLKADGELPADYKSETL